MIPVSNFKTKRLVAMFNHCVIMAAGNGSRLFPLTEECPKPLIEVNGFSLMSYTLIQIRKEIENIAVTVGHKGDVVAGHAVEEGATMIITTRNKGNAWWMFKTLLNRINEPLLVLPCDNIVELNLEYIYHEYTQKGYPPCLLFPVRPVTGIKGDYITGKDGVVSSLSRNEPTGIYCSGIQVVNPSLINQLVEHCEHFYELWNSLIRQKQLFYSGIYPYEWYSVNTKEQFYEACRSKFRLAGYLSSAKNNFV